MRIVILFLVFAFFGYACNRAVTTDIKVPEPSGLPGEELAKLHCSGCHVFPEPAALPKMIWISGILPKMALRLGMGDYMLELMNYSNDEMMAIMHAGVYPENPVMAREDWDKIVSYYKENAPDSLVTSEYRKSNPLTQFVLSQLEINSQEIVLTQFDSIRKELYVGNSGKNNIFRLTGNGQFRDSTTAKSPVVDVKNHKQLGQVHLEVGILNPSDLSEGRLMAGNKVLIDKLHRPVHLLLADLNEDNYDDFVISNFGNLFGSLVWYDGKTFKQHILSNEPGARVSYFLDFDKDGKKDILTLMTQGRESIVLHKNLGKGKFEMKPLLVFPPYFGSSYFEIKDLDYDGDFDLVYTNGDNADLSIVRKAFHGVRVYLNNGKNQFQEKYFYPINGASKVVAEDFDNDKDYDMAVISFFPDPKRNEGFLFFEGNGKLEFSVKSKEKLSDHKWLTLDQGDFDNDGDKDLILGAFNRELKYKPKVQSVVILENLYKK